MARDSLSAGEYERVLTDIYRYETTAAHQVKVTCAPQYMRIRQTLAEQEDRSLPAGHHGGHGLSATTRGCLGGIAFLFISHCGDTQPCGYLEINGGNVRTTPIRDIWESSPVYTRLRDYSALTGKCGDCEYTDICGGCRARAYEASGDYMGPEPLCPYVPSSMTKRHA